MRRPPQQGRIYKRDPSVLRAGAYPPCINRALNTSCVSQNFISVSTVRDITSLRADFLSALAQLGFVPASTSSKPSPGGSGSGALNTNSTNTNLVKAVIVGGLWPRVARVHLPSSAIKFDRVQAGTVQRSNTAKEYKMYDLREGRVFLHPASVLFNAAVWKSPFLAYFHKQMTSKVFLRDATEVRFSCFPCLPRILTLIVVSVCGLENTQTGPDLRPPALRWAGHREPHRRRAHSRHQRVLHQAQSVAAHRRPGQPPTVRPRLPPTYHVHEQDQYLLNLMTNCGPPDTAASWTHSSRSASRRAPS